MITHSFMTAIRACSTSITVAVHGIDTLRYVLGEIIFTDDKHLKTRPATYRLINLCFVCAHEIRWICTVYNFHQLLVEDSLKRISFCFLDLERTGPDYVIV